MTLREVANKLDQLDDALTICAARSPAWSATSEALLCPSHLSAADFPLPYFLEVAVAKDVIRAWSNVRSGRIPDLNESCEALVYFAENDAYLLPYHDE